VSKTFAIVLNWRTPNDTVRCVKSLLALDMDLSVVVIDNGSGDTSLECMVSTLILPAQQSGYTLYQEPEYALGSEKVPKSRRLYVLSSGKNGGYAFGNNYGAKFALGDPACEFVWILNSDTVVPNQQSMTSLLKKMDTRPDVGICGSTVIYMEDEGTVQTYGGGCFDSFWGRCTQLGQGEPASRPVNEEEMEAKLSYVNGACAFIRREFFEEVGFMDEGYFLYYEEIDWTFAGRSKYGIGYCAESVVLHSVGGSIGTSDSGKRSMLSLYYLTRSRIRFLRRFSWHSLPFAFLDLGKEVAQHIKRRRWSAAKTMLQATLGGGKQFKQFRSASADPSNSP
jgi:GT2 family glycosyltransferase